MAEHGPEVVLVHVVERPRARAADVVDDDVEPAELLDRGIDDCAAPSGVETSATTPTGRPGPAIVANRCLQPLRVAGAEDDVGSLGGERAAIPRPIPRLEPVTIATLPASPRSIGRSYVPGMSRPCARAPRQLVPHDVRVPGLEAELA